MIQQENIKVLTPEIKKKKSVILIALQLCGYVKLNLKIYAYLKVFKNVVEGENISHLVEHCIISKYFNLICLNAHKHSFTYYNVKIFS